MKHIHALIALVALPLIAAAQHSASVTPAEQLTRLLEERGLQAFAAEDPDKPGRFAAVLVIPGSQLLTITTTYSAPSLLRDLIHAGDYRQVYVDLSTAGERNGRLFVEDFGAPGLRATREAGEPFDITWRNVTMGTRYDGSWAAQTLSEREYLRRFGADDAAYADALGILLAALTAPAPGDATLP